jgi:hypothetical protein
VVASVAGSAVFDIGVQRVELSPIDPEGNPRDFALRVLVGKLEVPSSLLLGSGLVTAGHVALLKFR